MLAAGTPSMGTAKASCTSGPGAEDAHDES